MAVQIDSRRLIVSGRVQGVGFRYFTQKMAKKHEIKGMVRNLADGRVEIMAEGNVDDLLRFTLAIRKGPPASAVEGVHQEELPLCHFAEFRILR